MNEEIKNIENTDSENTVLTDDQVHRIYTVLSDVDKTSVDNLSNAEKETEESNYTSDDNNVIKADDIIPGVDAIPSNIADDINETEEDIKNSLSEYGLDDNGMVQMLKIIEEYKQGKTTNLYSKLPEMFKNIIDGLIASDAKNASQKQILSLRNAASKMLIDSFINDAKISASVDEFSNEMKSTINQMNSEYDNMLVDAIDETFSKIEEIRAEDPEKAKRIESVKIAFENALTFDKQLQYAKNTPSYVFKKNLEEYKEYVRTFNKKVNNNTFGVKVPNIEEIIPIIKAAIPNKYTGNAIKKFIICICKTAEDSKELSGIAYNYRMISSIYRYKFTEIDEKGEIIFENISKVIDEII